ncbi:hypothetical protein MAR_018239 [Mya arenaria]|uniref:Transmembrane protein 135 N-terminal domain-containing protein n=1 Tax=Mya arenaria TaxID=6604 RepID=A0ABY7EHK3_MYAAR|nr:hypothetical protein MAR_018239 [Mya arenaria]
MKGLKPIREHSKEPKDDDNLEGLEDPVNGEESDEDEDAGVELSEVISERVQHFVKRFAKGFGSGVAVYSGIKVVTALMRNPFREGLPKIRADVLAKDGLKFATFMGLFPSIYDLAVELLEQYRGKRDDWNSALAGGIAGLAMVVEDRTRRRIYCLFAIARAIGAMISTLVKRGLLPSVPYSETALFCSCTSFLVYCTALQPQYLFTGYYKSVLKWSRDYTDEKLKKLFREHGDTFLTCADVGLHDQNCTIHAAIDFAQSIPPFAKLPKQVLKTVVKNTFWSTAFLATMVMVAKYAICLLRNLQHRPPPLRPWIPAAAGILAGLGVLFEGTHRRRELSLFLIPHTLYAVYLWAKEAKIVRHIPNSSILLFALALVPIMHAYEREPESLNLLLHSALKFFVGKRMSTVERKKRRTISEMSI